MSVFPNTIEHRSDVTAFFIYLRYHLKLNFHPDDRFEDYVNYGTQLPTFTAKECALYRKAMDDCHSWCQKNHQDIYDIALKVEQFPDFLSGHKRLTDAVVIKRFAKEFIDKNFDSERVVALHTYGGCYWIEEFVENGNTMFHCVIENAKPSSDSLRDMEVILFDWMEKDVPTVKQEKRLLSSSAKEKNIGRLTEVVNSLGFGADPDLFEALDESLSKGDLNFYLPTEGIFDGQSSMEALLHFHWSDEAARYFLIQFSCTLLYNNGPQSYRTTTFYLYDEKGVTFKEAFNLLQGRSVYTRRSLPGEEPFEAWITLDLDHRDGNGDYIIRQYRWHYGYDLEKVLNHYPIQEMNDASEKAHLLTALQRGDLHPVTFVKPRKTEKLLIAANPAFKTINILPMADTQRLRNRGHRR